MNHQPAKQALGLTAAVASVIGTVMLVPAAANAAKTHPAHVQTAAVLPDLSGNWKDQGGGQWVLKSSADRKRLTCTFRDFMGDPAENGVCSAAAEALNEYIGEINIKDGASSTIQILITSPNELQVTVDRLEITLTRTS